MTPDLPWHPSRGPLPAEPDQPLSHRRRTDIPADDLIESSSRRQLGAADCCGAQGRYRVVLARAVQPQGQAELVFCGHHLRVARNALSRAGATIFDEDGYMDDGAM